MARQWQTVLVSVTAHVGALFLLVAVPLLAVDGFPELRSAVEYVPIEMKVPELLRAPQPPALTPGSIEASPSSIPLAAPDTVAPEQVRGLPRIDAGAGTVGGFEGLPGSAKTNFEIALPPAPQAHAPIRPGGDVRPPDRIVFVKPAYPPVAVSARVSGLVVIEAIIGTDGTVRDAKVLRSIPLLDEAASRAVRQWRYRPTLLNGMPVPVVMTVTVRFSLDRIWDETK